MKKYHSYVERYFMEIKTLEAFLALASHLNFTKSAEQMFISQPAFSRQITRLEEELGCSLFTRNKRRVVLTDYGRAFQEHAARIVSEYERWTVALQNMKSLQAGQLRVGYLHDLLCGVIPKVISSFKEKHGDIEINFIDMNMSKLVESLSSGEVDCIFTLSNVISEYHDISRVECAPVPICAVLPPDHKFADRKSLKLSELKDETFVFDSPEAYSFGYQHTRYLCKAAGFKPKVATFSNHTPSLLLLVSCGVGISILAGTANYLMPEKLHFIPLEDEYTTSNIIFAWKSGTENSAVSMLAEVAAETADTYTELFDFFPTTN